MLDFQVEGMTCGHCERAIARAVRLVDPAAMIEVDRLSGRVTVQSYLDEDAVRQAIESEGYRVR